MKTTPKTPPTLKASEDEKKTPPTLKASEDEKKTPPTLKASEDNRNVWARFDIKNQQHKYILSLLRQIGWTKPSDRYGTIADMERLGEWLQSHRTPVNKPLVRMDQEETTKIINALESMLGKKWSKK